MSVYDKIISNIENDNLSTYDMLYIEREFNKNKNNMNDELKSANFRVSMESMLDVVKELKVIEEMKKDNSVYNSTEAFQSECYAYMDTLNRLRKQLIDIVKFRNVVNPPICEDGSCMDKYTKEYSEYLFNLCNNAATMFNDENVLIKVKELPYEELYNKNTNIGKHIHDYLHKLARNDHSYEHIVYTSDIQLVLLLKYLVHALDNEPFMEANIPVIINDNVVNTNVSIGEYATLLYSASNGTLCGKIDDSINKIIDKLRDTLSDAYIEPNNPSKLDLIVQEIASVASLHDKLKQYIVGLDSVQFV